MVFTNKLMANIIIMANTCWYVHGRNQDNSFVKITMFC